MRCNSYIIFILAIILTPLLVSCNMLDTKVSSENPYSQTSTATPFINNTHDKQHLYLLKN
jgi:hypothetical protein